VLVALFPIEHEHRLSSPAEAAAFFGALRERRVTASGFATTDPSRMEALVAALDPDLENTVRFEGGELSPAAREALQALALSAFGYLDVRTAAANLRVWPELHSWVHAGCELEAWGRGVASPLKPGANVVGEDPVEMQRAGGGYAWTAVTPSIATALRLFHAVAGTPMTLGHVTGTRGTAKPALARFLGASAARVSANLELDLVAARQLTDLYPGEPVEWQAYGLLVELPAGRIHGFLRTPDIGERHRRKWHKRVSKALRRAGLV